MNSASPPPEDQPFHLVVRAWFVHLYTAMGLVVGFFSLVAISQGRAQEAFYLSMLAFAIDGTDGVMARAFQVTVYAARFDGRKLDDITDFINYVLVPLYFAARFQFVEASHLWILCLPLLASGYGFCCNWAKTDDGFFTGFPSYWNIMVLYMYLLKSPIWLNEACLLLFAVLVFVPVKYLYPTKTKPMKWFTLPYSGLWFVMVAILVLQLDHPNPWLLWGSLTYPVYYIGFSLYLHATGHHDAHPPGDGPVPSP